MLPASRQVLSFPLDPAPSQNPSLPLHDPHHPCRCCSSLSLHPHSFHLLSPGLLSQILQLQAP